jgi:4-hydroxythreonine-4-phosphate dehydrogenase
MTVPRMSTQCLALTLGDPRGIGPEVVVEAIRFFQERGDETEFVLFGPDGFDPGLCRYEGVGAFDGSEPCAGSLSVLAVERAVELSLTGVTVGLVTGPIHKVALRMAGIEEPGHTEMLQRLTGVPNVGMLMAAEETRLGAPLRVLLATTHVALRGVPDLLSVDLLVSQTTLLASALEAGWGLTQPRLALCAVNPHASDGGLFGDEEERLFRPAVDVLRRAGISVDGPIPADTVFKRALDGEYDAVVAPYHDVGMAAFKTVAFGTGVNVTLGLPFVRTSPDHGTAFDIVGTGKADASSMQAAIQMASKLAAQRFDTLATHM